MCTHILFVGYFLLIPYDLKRPRVIKEYFMDKLMFDFIGSNPNMTFAIMSETVVGKNIVTKTAFEKFLLLLSLPLQPLVGGF